MVGSGESSQALFSLFLSITYIFFVWYYPKVSENECFIRFSFCVPVYLVPYIRLLSDDAPYSFIVALVGFLMRTPFHLHYDHLSGMRCPRKFLASNASSSIYWDIFTQFHQKGNGIKLSNYCDSFSVPHALIRGRCVHACVGGSITEATPLCEIICATGGRSVNDAAL